MDDDATDGAAAAAPAPAASPTPGAPAAAQPGAGAASASSPSSGASLPPLRAQLFAHFLPKFENVGEAQRLAPLLQPPASSQQQADEGAGAMDTSTTPTTAPPTAEGVLAVSTYRAHALVSLGAVTRRIERRRRERSLVVSR